MRNSLLLSLCLIGLNAFGQGVGIGTSNFSPNEDAVLELRSTSSGFLMPRMTQAQMNAIVGPSEGLIVYQTNGASGFKYFNGSDWSEFSDNLGNHTALTNFQLNDNWLTNDGGNEGIRISDNGYVGVGSADPQFPLVVNSAGVASDLISPSSNVLVRIEQTANYGRGAGMMIKGSRNLAYLSAFLDFSNYDNQAMNDEYVLARVGGFNEDSGEKGALTFYTNGGGTDDSGLSEKMRITSDGKVGLGVSTPSKELDVNGGARIRELAGSDTRMVVADANGNLQTQEITAAVTSALDEVTRAVSASSQQSTSSGSYADLNSMTMSVETGRYIFQFNCDMEVTNGNTVGEFSFLVNGSTVTESIRKIKPGTNSPGIATLITVVDVASSGTVKVQYKRNAGSGTVKVGGRTLMVMRIGE